MTAGSDALLDRVSDLLKLCDRADQTGARVVTTATVRAILCPPPTAARPTPYRRTRTS